MLKVDGPARLSAAPLRIEPNIVNLLAYAVEFSPPKSEIQVTVAQPDPKIVTVSVRDFGRGIPPEHRERLFDRFYQVDATEQRTGLGLGLYVSRQIAELRDGRLRVRDPEHGDGVEFVLELPIKKLDPVAV